LAKLAVYEVEKVFENVERQGAYLAGRLEAMKDKYACIGDVRYKGLFSMLSL
jgi:taurine--2-oxoglutarate transaminase